ncbi:MAG: hypothetical protein WCF20_13455 [Methylovirgula sp.]
MLAAVPTDDGARQRALTALERAKAQAMPFIEIDPALFEEFERMMRENLISGSIPFRKAYLQAIVSSIEVDDPNSDQGP